MISLQPSKEVLQEETLSKKRKWDREISDMPGDKLETTKPIVELQNQTQFPQEWQRCLDIKSGKVYFYNTRTNQRASGDPACGVDTGNLPPMSLELELNLPCRSACRTNGHFRSPSWLTFEGQQQEMVTAVCKKCFMLVMMSKSCPSCPNCKFVHPPEHVQTSSIKG